MAQKVYQEFQKAADRHLKTCLELTIRVTFLEIKNKET